MAPSRPNIPVVQFFQAQNSIDACQINHLNALSLCFWNSPGGPARRNHNTHSVPEVSPPQLRASSVYILICFPVATVHFRLGTGRNPSSDYRARKPARPIAEMPMSKIMGAKSQAHLVRAPHLNIAFLPIKLVGFILQWLHVRQDQGSHWALAKTVTRRAAAIIKYANQLVCIRLEHFLFEQAALKNMSHFVIQSGQSIGKSSRRIWCDPDSVRDAIHMCSIRSPQVWSNYTCSVSCDLHTLIAQLHTQLISPNKVSARGSLQCALIVLPH